ncbi:MAG: phosphoglycerate mutase family protein [Flavobacteriales bacterium]|nr:phosphoglycerate mutase family protein [Flavobacteriales bacterium]MDG1797868.1 phosphoglycerate mutase family protein [Flavobacteriales bacterium]
MIIKYLYLVLISFVFSTVVYSQNNNEIFTIYLVRHSEKEISSNNNPELTKCGDLRSENLSFFLKDVPLDAVYSTDYLRTKNTAFPTAKSKELKIEYYNPNNLEQFSKLLKNLKKDVLVVGHSNTTGVLAGLLIGEEIGEFDLNIYNRVYQVVVSNENSRLHLLHTAFKCED